MARKRRISTHISDRVTLALRLADGSRIEIGARADTLRFIGRISRVSAFGPVGSRIAAQRLG